LEETIMARLDVHETNISLVCPDDHDYLAFMARIREQHPGRGGPRHAGEFIGGIVEQSVSSLLAEHVPLQQERILTWEQRMRNGRNGRLYRELDGVWKIDHESLCVFEIKFTLPELISRGNGIKQLNIAQRLLLASRDYEYVLKRLVYVADEMIPVLDDPEGDHPAGLPALEIDDAFEELGVIWFTTEAIAVRAAALGLSLPENWTDPETRAGEIYDPEREEWRQYSDTADVKPEEAESPLARALRLAKEKK
jgi:hypothetical protein